MSSPAAADTTGRYPVPPQYVDIWEGKLDELSADADGVIIGACNDCNLEWSMILFSEGTDAPDTQQAFCPHCRMPGWAIHY